MPIQLFDVRLVSSRSLAYRAREYAAAFEWLGWALDQQPDDPVLRSRVGYLQMAVGDINAAIATFQVS